MKNKIISMLAMFALAFPIATSATIIIPVVDECGAEFSYTKSSDFSDSRVFIDYGTSGSDETVKVKAQTGYELITAKVDASNPSVSPNEQTVYPASGGSMGTLTPDTFFNPSGTSGIDDVTVKVKKTCEHVCNDEAATNYEPLVTGETQADNGLCEYPAPTPTPEPTPTPPPASAGGKDGDEENDGGGNISGGFVFCDVLDPELYQDSAGCINRDDYSVTTVGEWKGNANCGVLLTKYLRQGDVDPEVSLLNAFLSKELGINLGIGQTFDTNTFLAVSAFQLKYFSEVLLPWMPYIGNTEPSGLVYKTTEWKINEIFCPSLDIPFPVLP